MRLITIIILGLNSPGDGESFPSGLIYSFLSGQNAEHAVNYGAAHGALAMTTPGYTIMTTVKEVKKLMAGAGERVDR